VVNQFTYAHLGVSISVYRSKICIVKLGQNLLKHETGLEKNYKNFNTNQEKFPLIPALTQR